MNWTINQTVDLSRGYTPVVWPDALMASGDDKAHTWRVTVMDGGQPADLSGATITGYFVRDDGATVAVAGSVSGNTVSVTLTGECYAIQGRLMGSIQMVRSGATVTLTVVVFSVRNTRTDDIVNPGQIYHNYNIDGTPRGAYPTLAALTAANPDRGYIYVVVDDGNWYYWGGAAWTSGGVYQAFQPSDMALIIPDNSSAVPDFNTSDVTLTFQQSTIVTNHERIVLNPVVVDILADYPIGTSMVVRYRKSTGTIVNTRPSQYTVSPDYITLASVYKTADGIWRIAMNGDHTIDGASVNASDMAVIIPDNSSAVPDFNTSDVTLTFEKSTIITNKERIVLEPVVVDILAEYPIGTSMILRYRRSTGAIVATRPSLYAPKADYITIAVVYKTTDGIWHLTINCEHTVNGMPKGTTFPNGRISGMLAPSDLPGIGDVESPFDYTNDNHTLVYSLYDALVTANPEYITRTEIGTSRLGVPIYEYAFCPKRATSSPNLPKVLLGAAIHGGENLAVTTLYYFCKRICDEWTDNEAFEYIRTGVNLHVIPLQNPDAYNQKAYILNHINMNRNFDYNWAASTDPYKGPAAFSEPESQAVRDFLITHRDAVVMVDTHIRGGVMTDEGNGKHTIIRSGSILDKDAALVVGLSTLEIARMTVEYMTAYWHRKYPASKSTEVLGVARIPTNSDGWAIGYAEMVLGIPSLLFEGFSRITSVPALESGDVVNMNVDFYSRLILNTLRYYGK